MSSNTTDTHLIHLEERTENGARIFSPTGARNKGPISEVLTRELPKGARVLEIGSGTGEHAVTFCQAREDIIWQPSDPDARSRDSISDWAKECPRQIQPPLMIDVSQPNWWKPVQSFDVIYSANMVHIAPWEATIGLAKGAVDKLVTGGQVILYGPLLLGESSAPSNLAFDARLKAKNPQWGVRELDSVKDIFADNGLVFSKLVAMPANNHIVIFTRA